jgi:hypothetical protein
MTPSTTYTAGIVCKKVPLTINGTGTLNIISTNGGNGALDYGDGSDCVCEISGGSPNGGAPNDIIYLYRQKIH